MIHRREAIVSTHGGVTIPVELRRPSPVADGKAEGDTKPDTRLIVREEEGRIAVMTMAAYVHSLRSPRGVLKGKGMMESLRERKGGAKVTSDNKLRQ